MDSEKQSADDKRQNKSRRILKGLGVGCATLVGLIVLLVIVASLCAPAPDRWILDQRQTEPVCEQDAKRDKVERVEPVSEQDEDLVEVAAHAVSKAEAANRKVIDHELTLESGSQHYVRAERFYQQRIAEEEERLRRFPRQRSQVNEAIDRWKRQFQNDGTVIWYERELEQHQTLIEKYKAAQKVADDAVKRVEKAGLIDKLCERLPGL